MTTADLLREIDQRNRDEYARQRMGSLIDAYLAPTARPAVETAIESDGSVASEPLPPPGLLSTADQAARDSGGTPARRAADSTGRPTRPAGAGTAPLAPAHSDVGVADGRRHSGAATLGSRRPATT